MNVKMIKRTALLLATTGTGFAAGLWIGYLWGQKREIITVTPSDEPEEPKEEAKEFDPNQMKFNWKEEGLTQEEADALIEVVIVEEVEEPAQLIHNFVQFSGNDNWDYEAEALNRDEVRPYILHYDEYMQDERGYSQTTLTFFSGDNILVDEEDVPIYDHERLVGELKFGHGSNDPNVVYVRNPRLQSEWEILLSLSSYASEVLNLDVEEDITKRSTKKQTPKFRKE